MKQLIGYLLATFFVLAGSHAVAQTITTFAGNGTWSFSGDGGPATAAALAFPIDVYVTSSDNVYIVDEWSNRIRRVDNSGTITTVVGNGTTAWTGTGVPATAAGLSHPRSVCVDAAGNIFIGDDGNSRVRKVTPSGLIFNAVGNGTWAYTGDGGMATDASIFGPWAVCIDASGNLYIGDRMNNVVRKVTPAGIISTFAGTGVPGYSGDGGPATAAEFMGPAGMCFDAGGNMYVADYNTVRKISSSGIVTTVAGNGTAGYSGDGGMASAATITNAGGICLDASGNLFFAEQDNNVIRKVTPAGIISTYVGTGTAGYSGDNGPPTAAKLNGPIGLRMDGRGNMFIADYNNQRIRKVAPYNVGVGATGAADLVINVYPNPASSTLFVECQQPVNVRILSLDGRLVLKENNAEKINLHHLAPGSYILCLLDPVTGARLYDKVIRRE